MPPLPTPVRRSVERGWEEFIAWSSIVVAVVALLAYVAGPSATRLVVVLVTAAVGGFALLIALLKEQRDMHRETRERLEQLTGRLDRLEGRP